MIEVKWLREALQDLQEIGRFIAQDDPAAAYRVLTRIETAALSLRQYPQQGRPGRVPPTRELVISGLPYILPYYLKQQEVRILAVMHTSRKWPDTFQDQLP